VLLNSRQPEGIGMQKPVDMGQVRSPQSHRPFTIVLPSDFIIVLSKKMEEGFEALIYGA